MSEDFTTMNIKKLMKILKKMDPKTPVAIYDQIFGCIPVNEVIATKISTKHHLGHKAVWQQDPSGSPVVIFQYNQKLAI